MAAKGKSTSTSQMPGKGRRVGNSNLVNLAYGIASFFSFICTTIGNTFSTGVPLVRGTVKKHVSVNVSEGGRIGTKSTRIGIAVPIAFFFLAYFLITYFSETPIDQEVLGTLKTQYEALSLRESDLTSELGWRKGDILRLRKKIAKDAATNANERQASNEALLKATTEQTEGQIQCEKKLENLITKGKETNCKKKTEDDNAHNEDMQNTWGYWLRKIFNFLMWVFLVVWVVASIVGCLFRIITGNAFFKKANTSTDTKSLECFENNGLEQKTTSIQPEVDSTACNVVQGMCTAFKDESETKFKISGDDFLKLMDEERNSRL